jgi:hypothetical protein
VIGQMLPGLMSVLHPEVAAPEAVRGPYVVFAGNVGDDNAPPTPSPCYEPRRTDPTMPPQVRTVSAEHHQAEVPGYRPGRARRTSGRRAGYSATCSRSTGLIRAAYAIDRQRSAVDRIGSCLVQLFSSDWGLAAMPRR